MTEHTTDGESDRAADLEEMLAASEVPQSPTTLVEEVYTGESADEEPILSNSTSQR